jgi:tetratricopeptide (TPR) repeat protein
VTGVLVAYFEVMKKTVLFLILILVAVYGILAMISSSEDYAAEKLFYHAIKIKRIIAINPDVTPPVMLTSVEGSLKEILERYPRSKMAKGAHLTLAEFYLENKKYGRAHSTLEDIINTYSQDKSILSKAHFLKGITYEKQNLLDEALKEYKILQDKYIDTHLGLQIPLYIGDTYVRKGRYTEADKAYNEAALFYERLESENRGKTLGYAAANLLLQAYLNLKQYEQAGKTLEDTVNNYPELPSLVQQMPNIELIFVKKLKEPEKAIAVYNSIKEKTNNSKLLKFIEERIKTLEAQK